MDTNDEVELGNYWRIFQRSWWMIALAMLAMTALAIALLPGQVSFFSSDVSVLLRPGAADDGPQNDRVNEDLEVGIATSGLIGTRVIAEEPDIDLEEWNENLTVVCFDGGDGSSSNCDSQILQFTYAADTAEEAVRLVEGSADAYLEFRVQQETRTRQDEIDGLETQLRDLALLITNERAVLAAAQEAADGEDTSEINGIERRLALLEEEEFATQRVLEDAGDVAEVGNLLGEPSTPEEDATGIPRLFTLIAGILMGLVVGALAAVLTDRLDRRISGPVETELDLGVPVLGNIPRIADDNPAMVTASGPETAGAEAFRRLAAAVLAPRNGFVVDSLVITGATDKEGRTTAAINLAVAISQTGRNVLLIGADRRNDALDRVFGLAGRSGLSDFLRSAGDLDAARTAIDNAEQRLGLTILPTGSGAPTPIANNSVAALLAIAQERNMIVVFDAPPALTNAEGLQLAAIVDAVYIVSAVGRTKRSELRDLRIQLENVQADVAGALLNRTSRLNILPTGSADVGSVVIPSGVAGGDSWQQREGMASVHKLDSDPAPPARMSVVSDEEEATIISEQPIEPGDVG